MRILSLSLTAILVAASGVPMANAATIIDDFSGGVTAVNHPAGAGVRRGGEGRCLPLRRLRRPRRLAVD